MKTVLFTIILISSIDLATVSTVNAKPPGREIESYSHVKQGPGQKPKIYIRFNTSRDCSSRDSFTERIKLSPSILFIGFSLIQNLGYEHFQHKRKFRFIIKFTYDF